jgi:cytochrome c553
MDFRASLTVSAVSSDEKMLRTLPVLFFFCTGGAAIAQATTEEITYLSCRICHDAAGPATSIPVLKGRSYEELIEKLNTFIGEADVSTIMHRFASGFTAAELDNLARYISGLEGDVR